MTIKRSLNQLVDPGLVSNPLSTAESFDNTPASRVPANPAPAADPATSDGGGYASPLTEQSRVTTTVTIPVPSGATSVDVEAITQLTMTDANGVALVFNFTAP